MESLPAGFFQTTLGLNEVIVFFNVGYNSKNGIASVCLHTLAPISLVIGKSEIEFIKEIDDPKGDETDPAKRILAVPIMPTQDNMFTMPKGVIIAVNTFDGCFFLWFCIKLI